MRRFFLRFLIAVVLSGLFTALGSDAIAGRVPDYTNDAAWVLKEPIKKQVDLFFIHPTSYFDTSDGLNASLDNNAVNRATDTVVTHQTGVFAQSCNRFAPRYRQSSIAVLEKDETIRDNHLKLGYGDIKKAFDYYMAHYNQGRPVIIAGHSQGSNLALWLLLEGNLPVKQIVAAYLIGWTVTDADLAQLNMPLSSAPDQTGCLIAWNTISAGGKSPVVSAGARVVNPLTWTSAPGFIPRTKNLGAVILMPDNTIKTIPQFTGAQIDPVAGELVIPPPLQ